MMKSLFVTESSLPNIPVFVLVAQQGVQFWAQNQIVRCRVYRNVRIYVFACMYAFVVLAVVQHVVAEICGPPSL